MPTTNNSPELEISGCVIDNTTTAPLDDFNNAYNNLHQTHERIACLVAVLKGEDNQVSEQPQPPNPQCIKELLTHTPGHIRSEITMINDQITEIEEILFT
ncbi:MAG: hypothetical protein GY814_02890 [Gammaproteobacteria bacterium]|nr:hypothetical protein [Gammaproteobacteria bacterium]